MFNVNNFYSVNLTALFLSKRKTLCIIIDYKKKLRSFVTWPNQSVNFRISFQIDFNHYLTGI